MASDQRSKRAKNGKAGLQRPKLSDVLYAELGSLIRSGAFQPDKRLPSEHELSDRYDVSRPIVRDALQRLREDGYIYSRQGAGSFVQRENPAHPEPRPSGFRPVESIADVRCFYEYRVALESEAAALAAIHRNETNLAEIQAALLAIEDAIRTSEIGVEQDHTFHMALARASQNSYFVSAIDAVREHLAFTIDLARSFSIRRSSEHLSMVQMEHKAIFDAISRKDIEGARRAMRDHIMKARSRVFEGI